MKDVRLQLYKHMVDCAPYDAGFNETQKDYILEYMQRYADYCLRKVNGADASQNKALHKHIVIASFFEITTEEVDMLKLLIQYKRELESDEGKGLSDDEYDHYEGLLLWFENGL